MLNDAHISVILVVSSALLATSQTGISYGQCVSPPYPEHGSYLVADVPNAYPGQIFDTIQLNITCHPGFKMIGKNTLLCIKGTWSDKVPECVRTCKLEKHASVKYHCVIGGRPQDGYTYKDCDVFVPVDTIVKPECNTPTYYSRGVLSHMHCTIHGWDYVAVCIPDCGKVSSGGEQLIINGKNVKRGEFPWHAGIYSKTSTPYMQICGGSLVSTTVVISAAHCFWNKYKNELFPESEYAVAVGKLYRPWRDPQDGDAQKSDVKEIKVPPRYRGSETHFQDDIAIVVLATTIIYKTYVKPVCLDFDIVFDKIQLQAGSTGKVSGWGLTGEDGPASPVLKVLDTPLVDIKKCVKEAPPDFERFITSDKICAGTTDGKAVCKGDSGGGLVFPDLERGSERYYLRGVVSTAPTNTHACNAFAITSFTQITAHTSFIEENTVLFHGEIPTRSGSQGLFCILPPYPNFGRYLVNGESDIHPGKAFEAVELTVICNRGYGVEKNRQLFCKDGSWSEEIPRCVRLCKLERHQSIDYRCPTNDNNFFRDCYDEELNGLVIRPECKAPFYFSRMELPFMTCTEGKWDNHPTCQPDCGRVQSSRVKGQNVSHGEFPWYAIIFKLFEGNFYQRCGGTLVSATEVISAAHCFWDEDKNELIELSEYVVAVGKLYRAWRDPRDPNAQSSEVLAVKIPNRFKGDKTSYQNDIAIVKLKTPFKFTPQVTPVCLDFDNNFARSQLHQESTGKAASWRIGAEEDTEDVLKILNMVYVTTEVCLNTSDSSYIRYITSDTICAERIDAPRGLCNGDSGGGFVLPDYHGGIERYYLRGVVSGWPEIDDACIQNHSIALTQLQSLDHFIIENLAW